ncbi:hypothetical protein D3C73_945400 [compost metagenome]
MSGTFQNPVHHLTRIIGNGSLFIKEGIRTVRQFFVQLGTRPVEHRHEIVADHLHANLRQFADGVDINIDIFITGRQADFDIIMNVDALHHSCAEALAGDLIRHFLDPFHFPHFTGYLLMQRPDNTHNPRNLPDMVKRNIVIAFTIPSPRHVHR